MLFVVILLNSCIKPCENAPSLPPKGKITIILLDISSSFNKYIKTEGFFKGENLFELSCEQVNKKFIPKMKLGESLIIRFIGKDSWGSKSFVSQINLEDTTLLPLEPTPCDPFKIRKYNEEKNIKKKETKKIIDKRLQKTIHDIRKLKEKYLDNPTSKTDICGALISCLDDFKSAKFKNHHKELIIYSDLVNTEPQNCENYPYDFQNISIVVKYISDNNHNPHQYKALIETWKSFFKNAKKFTPLSPVKSL